jgi:hypothetical protein
MARRLTKEEFELLMTAWSKDHVLGIESLFGIELTDQQKELVTKADGQASRVAVSSCTGSGKTAVLSMLTFLYLMILPDCRILITSPSFNQLNRVFSSELKKWHRKMPSQFQEYFDITRETVRYTNSIKYEQFASLVTASVENKEALQGGHAENYCIFADEASGVSEEAFDILLGTLSTGKGGRFIQVSNPVRSSGRFYQIFQNPQSKWNKIFFSAYNSPNVNPVWIEEMKETYGADSDLFRMRVLGKFPRVGVAQFISAEAVEEAINNTIPLQHYNSFPKVMGVDVARFGDDQTCFVVRQGPKVVEIKSFKGLNTMEVAARVAEFQAIHLCKQIHVDAIGVGAGTYDRCKELGLPVIEVNVSTRSTDPKRYCNLRSQIWGEMKDWINNGADLPYSAREKESNLSAELTSMEYFYNNKMQLQLMSKRDLKKMGHNSPDIADALSLTFASTVYQVVTRSRKRMTVKNKGMGYAW